MPPDKTPPSLLGGLANPDDHEAWTRFADLYRDWLLLYFRQANLQAQDCEDVTQNVLVFVHHRFAEFQSTGRTGSFRAWLKQVAYFKLLEHYKQRRHQTREEPEGQLEGSPDPFDALGAFWDKEHDEFVLRKAHEFVGNELSEVERKCFQAFFVDQLPAEVIAKQLEISIRKVYRIREKVLARLRYFLRGFLDDF